MHLAPDKEIRMYYGFLCKMSHVFSVRCSCDNTPNTTNALSNAVEAVEFGASVLDYFRKETVREF